MTQARTNRYVVLRAGARPSVEVEIKRSRFIGYAARVDTEQAARDFLAELRAGHREARHVCHAFVLGADRDTQRSSDDGEPSGTAGAPILKAITGRQTSGQLRTPMMGMILKIHVAVGERVRSGDVVATMESMKMELRINADHDGVVRSLSVQAGQMVERGLVVAVVESEGTAE